MEILVHQEEFNNNPVRIGVTRIRQVFPIDDAGVHNSAIITSTRRFVVIETKEQVDKLIKEAILNG